jgi:hypothetical protein
VHDGMAFLPFHLGLAIKFEKTLQLIEPKVRARDKTHPHVEGECVRRRSGGRRMKMEKTMMML